MNTLIPDVRIVLDEAGIVQEASTANELSDESVKPWVGQPWASTLQGIDPGALAELVRSSAIEGVTPIFHLSQTFPSGLVAPLEYLLFHDADKHAIVAIGRDVRVVANLQSRLAAARQSMERDYWKMRDLESRYRSLYEASSDPLLLIDAEACTVIEANPAAILVLDLSAANPEAGFNSSLLDAIAAEERDLARSTIARAREHGSAPRILVRVGVRHEAFMLRARALEEDRDHLLLVHLSPVQDSTIRHGAAAEKPYSVNQIFDLAPDGIVVLDAEGRILDANPSFVALIEQPTLAPVAGTSMDRWLGNPGGDWTMLLDSLRLCEAVHQFPTTIKGEFGGSVRAEISAVMSGGADRGFIVLYIRDIGRRADVGDDDGMLLQFLREMSTQLGESSLKEIVSTAVGLVERYYIEVALDAVGGNRTAAARMLGVSRQGLYDKLARYQIDPRQQQD